MTTPRPIRDKGRRPDIETELRDKYHVDFAYLTNVPTSHFDIDRSLHNQARFEPLDEATVALYQEGVERGDPFPAVIAWRRGRGANPKLEIVDGNHRLVAHHRAGVPIEVYEIDRATKPNTITMMTFAFNTRHGRPTSPEERVSQALFLVDNGASQTEAAAAVNLKLGDLKRAVARANADKRAAEVGADLREWDLLPQSVRTRLLNISTDEGFHDAIHLTFAAKLNVDEVFDLVTLLNTSKSGNKQRAIVKAQTQDVYAERIQDNAGGVLSTGGRRPMSPRSRVGMVLGQVLALPEDLSIIARAYSEAEKAESGKRIYEAGQRLISLAHSVDPDLK